MRGRAGSAAGRESPAGLTPQATVDQPAVERPVVDEPAVDEPTVDEHCRRRSAEPLRPYVAYYTGYRQRGVPPARHRGLPSPFLTLIFTLDEPLVMLAHPDPRQPPGDFGALLGGLHSAPALITHDGAQSGIQVALRPLGARALLGLPAGELAELDLPAETVLGGACAELRARTVAATSWPERFAILDEILLRRAGPGLAGPARLARLGWHCALARARGRLGLAPAAGLGRHGPHHRPGRRDGLERPSPDRPVPHRDRADPEGCGPGHPVRPGPAPADPPCRRRRVPAGRPGRSLRLL